MLSSKFVALTRTHCAGSGSGPSAMQTDQAPANPDAMTEEEQIQWALRMSMQGVFVRARLFVEIFLTIVSPGCSILS